ncbi:DNA/RNA non-specific endonuclease [Adhaeribacter aquaticus]|uniref:DNA/RNA non-specific endonuclease n=1 Tax=Adhaeribacter aquaticus TaxID=299567 RepID=UPI00041333FE|nr:DNA/RNA non-specific endonuclease [Adhaeribacter aquaticus]
MRIRLYYLFFIYLLAFACQKDDAPQKPFDLIPEVHTRLGNPSNATAELRNSNNFLITKNQYVLSYNKDKGIPNWVSWHVSKHWLGNSPRQDDFKIDNALPAGWYRVAASAYTGSGFDRGHNAPSGDRTKSVEDNSATFLMTNMIPQAPNNNRETWENLESYTRLLVSRGTEVYVIMGNYGKGGTGSNGYAETIDQGRITVPKQIWKVLVVLPEGENDLSRINTNTRVIAIKTPNNNDLNPNWGVYRTTVDAIEKATGYDLLSELPDNIEAILEAKVDKGETK